jgi:hypothetical protein
MPYSYRITRVDPMTLQDHPHVVTVTVETAAGGVWTFDALEIIRMMSEGDSFSIDHDGREHVVQATPCPMCGQSILGLDSENPPRPLRYRN